MPELSQSKCIPCQVGGPTLSDDLIARFRKQVPEWELIEVDGVKRITRKFKFKDFAEALKFTNKVGKIAEDEGHHPQIKLDWGKVRVTWWTHKINGLHLNDFIMAAKTDLLI